MKIIKKGTKTPPDEIVYITKCKTCGCKFTYMEKDVMLSWFREEYLKCPQCSYKVPVPNFKKKYKGVVYNNAKEIDKNNVEIKIADLKRIYLRDNKTKLFLTEDDKKKFTSDYIDNHNVKRQ